MGARLRLLGLTARGWEVTQDTEEKATHRWKIGGGTTILVIISLALFTEFRDENHPLWTAFLFIFLTTVAVGAIVLQRYFSAHADEIGEARFDTRNKEE